MPISAMQKLIVVALLALLALALRPIPMLACSCADGAPNWEAVFFGRVVAVIEGEWIQERLWQEMEGFGSTVALLEVDRIWQGAERRFVLVVGSSGNDCMLSFVPGARYKINLLDDEGILLSTNTCIGSRPMNDPAA